MENTRFWVQNKDHGEKDSLSEEEYSASQLKKLVKGENSHEAIVENINQKQNSNVFLKGLFFLLVHGHNKIPKHVASADDEMYAATSALKASQYNTPLILQAKNMLTSEKSLNSPLPQKFGASERNHNLNMPNFTDAKDMMCYDFMDSPSGFSVSSSHKLEMETPMVQSHNYGSTTTSTSSTSSTCYGCLSSASLTPSKGMIQCTWKQGIPHFVFSIDDQKQVYVAKLSKVDTKDEEALDYVYLIHKCGQKGHEISGSDLQLVGKMNVSTTFTLCHDNYTMMETQFVLFGDTRIHDKEMCTSSHSHWKHKGLSKKLSQVFRNCPSSKHRTLSKFGGSSPIVENCPKEINLLEANVPPNFELAAIIIKEQIPFQSLGKVGGWGLKFLNKCGVSKTALPCESYYGRNNGNCSTSSMSIVIPAGIHGGPRTRHGGGPSSLIDRWRSGGCCDCGGWDEGCPLTVLQRRTSSGEVLPQLDMHGECKPLDLVTQGSSNFSPTLRMVNIHDGLYFVHFQPSLSALQSFSIAMAIIHTQSHALRPKRLSY